MSTTTVLGGVGLFLLGMSVMTAGLKDLAGSKLRDTLRKMAATPLSLREAWAFISEAGGPPASQVEQTRLTRTLHALDEASRLAGIAGSKESLKVDAGVADSKRADTRGGQLCATAMRNAVLIAEDVVAPEGHRTSTRTAVTQAATDLERSAKELHELHEAHRSDLLASVAAGTLRADEAAARVDAVRRLDALARHASLCAGHLMAAG